MSRTFHMVSALVTGLVLLAPGVAAASAPPTAVIAIDPIQDFGPNIQYVGQEVQFDGSGSYSNGGGGTLSYHWRIINVDRGEVQSELDGATVRFTFSRGWYQIELTVSDDGGTNTDSKVLTVYQKTSLRIAAGPGFGVLGGVGPPQTTVEARLVTEPQHQPLPNQQVSFSFIGRTGAPAPDTCTATTDENGFARCSVTFILPGQFTFDASFYGIADYFANETGWPNETTGYPTPTTVNVTGEVRGHDFAVGQISTPRDRMHVGDRMFAISIATTGTPVGVPTYPFVPFNWEFTLTQPDGSRITRSGQVSGFDAGRGTSSFDASFDNLDKRGVHRIALSVRERFLDVAGSLGEKYGPGDETFAVYQRTALSLAELSGPPGAPLTASATLRAVGGPGSGAGVPDQLVSFSFTGSGAPGDCQARTDEQGVARCPVTFSSRGRYTAQASFAAYDFFDEATASREVAIGATPPTIAPLVTGTRGTDGWYTSDVTLGWSVSEELFPETLDKTGCGDVSVTSDQAATDYTCSASSAGGSAEPVTVTIKRDATNPTVTYANNAGSYGLQDTVAITCAAADNLSGLASTTCTNTQDAAWTLGPGEHTLSATATDAAGNVGSNSTRFTVVVTPASLCQLTTQLVKGSPAYLALTPKEQKTLDKRAEGLCAKLVRIVPKLSPSEKAQLVSAVKDEIQSLVPTWLTQDQANKLKTLADAL